VWLDAGDAVDFVPDPSRRYWLHVAQGEAVAGERILAAGDALGFTGESTPLRLTGTGADILLFDLPA
jgi:redox-sensitive bicupin YhaK (pirin superfamily)